MIDWNYLTAQGQGVFAGVSFAIDNPVKDWWGEGDEKIYVDGETFPSHFGTGTEDYYGYAWCWPELFTHAYHAQPRCDGPGNYGRTSVNRFHILDRIPFTKDFKFDMELWHWHAKCKVNMAVTAYWYARPGATDGFQPIRAEDAVVRPMAEYVVPRVAGAMEGEGLKIVRVTGMAEPQDWDGLSGGRHLWWHAGMKPGDQLVVSFPAPEGRQVPRRWAASSGPATTASTNWPSTASRPGEPLDFYNPDVQPSPETGSGRVRPEGRRQRILGHGRRRQREGDQGLHVRPRLPAAQAGGMTAVVLDPRPLLRTSPHVRHSSPQGRSRPRPAESGAVWRKSTPASRASRSRTLRLITEHKRPEGCDRRPEGGGQGVQGITVNNVRLNGSADQRKKGI